MDPSVSHVDHADGRLFAVVQAAVQIAQRMQMCQRTFEAHQARDPGEDRDDDIPFMMRTAQARVTLYAIVLDALVFELEAHLVASDSPMLIADRVAREILLRRGPRPRLEDRFEAIWDRSRRLAAAWFMPGDSMPQAPGVFLRAWTSLDLALDALEAAFLTGLPSASPADWIRIGNTLHQFRGDPALAKLRILLTDHSVLRTAALH